MQNDNFYYNEQGFIVFTEKYHLQRGYCCNNGCMHCPYGFEQVVTQKVSIFEPVKNDEKNS